jgi:hypothetical protein
MYSLATAGRSDNISLVPGHERQSQMKIQSEYTNPSSAGG